VAEIQASNKSLGGFISLVGWLARKQHLVMADARLQAKLAETKAEVLRLRGSLSVATPVLHKDLSLVSLVPKWSGSESSVSLEEFFASIESASRIGKWAGRDNFEIAVLKLTDSAKHFYQGCPELQKTEATRQNFKDTFRQKYKDVCTDKYRYMMLHTARQGKNEDAQQFADRCRALSQKRQPHQLKHLCILFKKSKIYIKTLKTLIYISIPHSSSGNTYCCLLKLYNETISDLLRFINFGDVAVCRVCASYDAHSNIRHTDISLLIRM
jgi:hypothetical protein